MAGKGPLNYTTSIEADTTAGECVSILAKHKASATGVTWDDGEPTGLTFQIRTLSGVQQYNLPVNVDATKKVLQRSAQRGDIRASQASEAQARRVAWRVVKTWLEAQLALIEVGLVEMDEVMLPYLMIDGKTTLLEQWRSGQAELTSGR
jgi:hypothetical protein